MQVCTRRARGGMFLFKRVALGRGTVSSNIRKADFNRTISSNVHCLSSPIVFERQGQCLSVSNNYSFVSSAGSRNFATGSEVKDTTEGEMKLKKALDSAFPKATQVIVEDISGGCGSMYQIYVEAPDFQGLSTVKQHLLVNNALKQEIKSMHGIRIQTAAPKS